MHIFAPHQGGVHSRGQEALRVRRQRKKTPMLMPVLNGRVHLVQMNQFKLAKSVANSQQNSVSSQLSF